MNLRETLEADNAEVSVNEKLEAIASTVAKARAAYANEDLEITLPTVTTTEGVLDLDMLSKADKLAVAKRAITNIRLVASEEAKNNEGVNVSKVIEALLATSPVLTNLTASAENDYGI